MNLPGFAVAAPAPGATTATWRILSMRQWAPTEEQPCDARDVQPPPDWAAWYSVSGLAAPPPARRHRRGSAGAAHAVGRTGPAGHVDQRRRTERAVRAAARVRHPADCSPTPSSRRGAPRCSGRPIPTTPTSISRPPTDRTPARWARPRRRRRTGSSAARPRAATSMVIDPPDGRVPPMTDEGQRRLRELRGTFANGNFSERALQGAGRSEPVGALHHARRAVGDLPHRLQRQHPHRAGARASSPSPTR